MGQEKIREVHHSPSHIFNWNNLLLLSLFLALVLSKELKGLLNLCLFGGCNVILFRKLGLFLFGS